MAGSLGSFAISLEADSSQLNAAMIQAKATTLTATKAISDAAKAQAAVITATSEQEKQALSKVAVARTQAAQGAAQMAQQAQQRYQAMAGSATQASTQIAAAHAKMNQGSQQASGGFGSLLKSGVALGAGFAGVALGAQGVHDAMVAVTESTLKAQQAQRALTAAFGDAAPAFKVQADTFATTFKKTNADLENGTALFGILQKQYGITSEESKKLTQITLDLNAAFGGDLLQTFHDVSNAIQGEPQALEKYGIALQQNAIVNSNLLTEAEKRGYESMSAISQARIRYRVLLDGSASAEGQAKKRTDDAAGAFDSLTRANDELAKVVGERGVPAVGNLARVWTSVVEGTAGFISKVNEVEGALARLRKSGAGFFTGNDAIDTLIHGGDLREDVERRRQDKANDDAINQRIAQAKQAKLDAQTRADVDAAAETERRKQQGERITRDLQDAHDARIKDLDDQRTVLEAAEDAELRSLEARKDARLKEIREAEEASKAASEREIARLQVEQETTKRAAQDAHDHKVQLLDAEQDAVKKVTDETVRDLEHQRDHRKKAAEDGKDAAIEALDAEKRKRDDNRIKEDRDREDQNQRIEREISHRHDAAVRALEDEAEQDRKKTDQKLRNLDRQSQKEEDRHRKAVQHIEAESQRQLDAIDTQLRALDDADRAEGNADRTAALSKKVADAQKALGLARGTGTPQQIAGARTDLAMAIRSGNAIGEANAREQLVRLAGQGDAAIKKADDDLAAAQQDLRDEGVKESRDAERLKLKDAQDKIRQQAEAEKRDEDERDRRRKDGLDKDKQAERDKLADVIDKLDKRKREESDAHDHEVEQAHDAAEQHKREIDDVRRKEEEDDQDARTRVQKRYAAEQEQIRLTYDDDERGLIPALHRAQTAADESYGRQRKAVDESLQTQQRQIDDTYNNAETGLITLQRRAADEARTKFNDMAASVTASFNSQKQTIQDTYTNKARTGLLDHLEDLKKKTDEELKLDLKVWEDWQKGLVDPKDGVITKTWADATAAAQKYFDFLKNNGGVTVKTVVSAPSSTRNPGGNDNDLPGGGSGGGGMGESLPPATTPPNTGGGGSAPAPTSIPSQINQYSFDDLSKLEQDAACGPAAIDWFSTMVGHPLTGRQAVNVAAAAGWDTTKGMYGPSAMSRAMASVGVRNKVNWDVSDELIDGLARRRVPFTMSTGEHYYQVYGGSIGGLGVGGSGLALRGGSSVMSLATIKGRGYQPQAVVIPDESSVHTRDAGYLFTEPTVTQGIWSGERNLIAERRPELLVGGAQTASMMRGRGGNDGGINYDRLAQTVAHAVAATRPIVMQGTAEDQARRISAELRREQREHANLRGVRT